VTITNKSTTASRTLTTNDVGSYTAPGLQAGDYTVHVEQKGFKAVNLDALVEAGSNSAADIHLTVGDTDQTVTVTAATPAIDLEGHTVGGVVEQKSIESIPTNGRSFVQLASLQPGVTVTARTQGIMNAPLGITVLGGGGQYPLVTVDGLQINDYLDANAGGGTAINFSNEVIQEFQLSSSNFDLATPSTMQGAVNMVTRGGTNDLHGSAYFFYRDHNMAAYPGLARNPNVPYNPSPYFARKNPGFTLGGPLLKNKLFAFGNYEYTGQTGVISVYPTLNSIKANAGVFVSPFHYNYTTVRLDYQPNRLKTNWFLRWTQDRNNGAAPTSTSAFPSNFVNLYNWSEQYALGATTAWTSNLVTELRFGFRDWHNVEQPPHASNCPGECLGGPVPVAPDGLPNLTMIGDTAWTSGDNTQAVQNRLARDYEPQVAVSWQKGTHNMKFGGDLDVVNIQWTDPVCAHGCMSVYSVENTLSTLNSSKQVAGASNPGNVSNLQLLFPHGLPSTVTANNTLLQLPISYPSGGFQSGFAVGPPEIPGPYEFNKQRKVIRSHFFWEDYWKVRHNLTINYGTAYTLDGRLFPIDMPIPGLMGPAYGLAAGQTQPPTPTNKLQFQPAFGYNWSPGNNGKTVLRGGFGLYWDTSSFSAKSHSLANYGPVGNGPLVVPSTVFTIPTVAQDPNPDFDNVWQQGNGTFIPLPRGSQVPTAQFTNLSLGDFMAIYNDEYPAINAKFTVPNPITSGPYQYSNVDLAKQNTAGFNAHFPMTRSYQVSVGVQQQLTHDMVLTVDWVQRFIQHAPYGTYIDLNHFTAYTNGVQTPVVPKCLTSQLYVLGVQCSSGAFSTYTNGARGLYEGMLVSLRKTMSHHFQFMASYALQTLRNSSTVVDLNHLDSGYGPTLARQNINVSGVANLKYGFDVAFNSSAITRAPVSYTTNGIDLSGTGATSSSPLPGLPVRGWFSHQQVIDAVTNFNALYAGKTAANGSTIPTYVLPATFQTAGRPQVSQDLRLTKTFRFEKRVSLSLYGEVFNIFNVANLSGYNYSLDRKASPGAAQSYTLGQPTARASQVFLSSGPRAEQVGARISF
jgi:hypothetical protein